MPWATYFLKISLSHGNCNSFLRREGNPIQAFGVLATYFELFVTAIDHTKYIITLLRKPKSIQTLGQSKWTLKREVVKKGSKSQKLRWGVDWRLCPTAAKEKNDYLIYIFRDLLTYFQIFIYHKRIFLYWLQIMGF